MSTTISGTYKNSRTETEGEPNRAITAILGKAIGEDHPLYASIDEAFRSYSAKHRIEPSRHHRARRYWLVEQAKADQFFHSPDEIDDNDELFEGARLLVQVNRYERDPVARRKCIEQYGYQCAACGFDFERHYGPIGRAYIHVHHLTPLSQIGQQYAVDPIKDLRPVCPNCHAMLHRTKETLSIEALRTMLKRAQGDRRPSNVNRY